MLKQSPPHRRFNINAQHMTPIVNDVLHHRIYRIDRASKPAQAHRISLKLFCGNKSSTT